MSALERFARNNHSMRARRERQQRLKPKPKPVHVVVYYHHDNVSDDGSGAGGYASSSSSLFSRRTDMIINQVLSPTIRHFGFDGASFNNRRSLSPRDKNRSPDSGDDEEKKQQHKHTRDRHEWDKAELLDLSDAVRACLRDSNSSNNNNNNNNNALLLSRGIADRLSGFLEAAVRDEGRKHPGLDYATVEYARLDKMVGEILLFAENNNNNNTNTSPGNDNDNNNNNTAMSSSSNNTRFRADTSLAKTLWRSWRRRFREHLFLMDQRRCARLVDGDGARLRNVVFDLGKWHTPRLSGPVSEVEGDLTFEPGHWWLNTTCAERDGIIDRSQETPTKGRYGFAALPLLTGSEEQVLYPNDDHNNNMTVKYVREGKMSDMHVALICQVGRQIRVLRGYRLKSVFAPAAGLRYDDIYTIKQYGCRRTDPATTTNRYRLELTLQRRADQRPLEDVLRVPRPSQVDDWALYEKLEGDKVRMLLGQSGYLAWKLRQQDEGLERDEWRRAKLFSSSAASSSSSSYYLPVQGSGSGQGGGGGPGEK
ncbi:PUA-like domain-containing protein [Xylariaceae sp. FL0594]|nr:PUA-like domain-containing protein [Xylariaceae sp. FL0594]